MDFGIAGKVAFVAGGSKGVGEQISHLLAREGCRVIVASRDEDSVAKTAAQIKSTGGQAIGVAADLTRKEELLRALEAGSRAFGGMPDIAISNIDEPASGDLMALDPEDFVKTFHELIISSICLAQTVIPYMQEKGWGRFVSINSGVAKEPSADPAKLLSSSIRSSAVSLNKCLASEFGPNGVTVNSIGAGYIETEHMHADLERRASARGISKAALIEETFARVPMRRPGTPEEEAALAVYLCSELAGYVTGQFIPVDGGAHRSAW